MKVGVGADHHGFEMKQRLAKLMAPEGHEVVDFGNQVYDGKDDDRDFAIALARAVACGDIERGVAVCGRGVSLRAALRHDRFSARQGVEDDTMNVLCPGPRASRRLEVHKTFLWQGSAAQNGIAAGWTRWATRSQPDFPRWSG